MDAVAVVDAADVVGYDMISSVVSAAAIIRTIEAFRARSHVKRVVCLSPSEV